MYYINKGKKIHDHLYRCGKVLTDHIPFMIKLLNQLGTEGNFLNLIKGICKTPSSFIIADEKLFSPMTWNIAKTDSLSFLSLSSHFVLHTIVVQRDTL
jgi:hypothetical protein